ncbi:hypothetical protein EK21DRAFT_119046 [Setomelanomma holmii]|uniref:Uncharacterized protein n=1 Tax=Setomelanomma holmii TaxID=210430 RepID=A0A9P4GWA9_9PLEO|nr:hypothetical protein EK21DRAFT_119046 [Setomelanomma holmii]
MKPVGLQDLFLQRVHEFRPLKPQLDEANLSSLFAFIWAKDNHNYDHPRYRIQIAFTLLLFYQLGLHPNVALKHGLFYNDTQILLCRRNNEIRVLLLITFQDRTRFSKPAERWRKRTMVLIDDPMNRDRCPVTLFLSLAMSDSVFKIVQKPEGLTTLPIATWPDWSPLEYRPEYRQLPVLRRMGNKSRLITSCPMKAFALYKMLQAQIKRAGHEDTYTAMLHDVRSSSKRDDKGEILIIKEIGAELSICPVITDGTIPIIVGRGHGKSALDLLSFEELDFTGLVSKAPNFASVQISLESPYPLSPTIQIQLRYDITRRTVISYLYESCRPSLPFLLTPFVEASKAIPLEPYFPDAGPEVHERCTLNWCQRNLHGYVLQALMAMIAY